jgi:hypothetical protein
MMTISDDDGDHINIAIPDYDKTASDKLLQSVAKYMESVPHNKQATLSHLSLSKFWHF